MLDGGSLFENACSPLAHVRYDGRTMPRRLTKTKRAPHPSATLSAKWGTRQFATDAERVAAQERFLEAFARTAYIVVGCEHAGVARQTVQWWLEHDEPFAMAYHLAQAEARDRVTAEIHRRAVHGVKRTKGVYYKGKLVATEEVTEYSDGLLLALAKRLDPEWRNLDAKREITGPDGGPLDLSQTFIYLVDGEQKTVSELTDDQLAAVVAAHAANVERQRQPSA